MTFVFQKVYEMGSADPFVARMMLQIMELRDSVFHGNSDRREFDEFYEPILVNLLECRNAGKQCEQIITDHKRKIASKQIISFQNKALTITESIDSELNRNFKDFFIKGTIALNSLERMSKFLGYSVKFAFGRSKTIFEKGSKEFLKRHPGDQFENFIQMLQGDWETWYPTFNEIRTKIEHDGFNLPRVHYAVDRDKNVAVSIPTINSKGIIDTLSLLWDNLFEFCEDIIVCQFGFKLDPLLVIVCVSPNQRDPQQPVKYKLSLKPELLAKLFPERKQMGSA